MGGVVLLDSAARRSLRIAGRARTGDLIPSRQLPGSFAMLTPSTRAQEVHRRKTRPFTLGDLRSAEIKLPFPPALDRALEARGGTSKSPSERADFSILDIGCGRGLTVALLRSLRWNAHGAEISTAQLELARRGCRDAGLPDTNFHRGLPDGSVDCDDQQFDLVLSDNVIEHLPDLNLFAAETKRLLLPHGYGCHLSPSRCHVKGGVSTSCLSTGCLHPQSSAG